MGVKILKRLFIIVLLLGFIAPAHGWSNGGYSDDPYNPGYGTHDYLLEKALNMLPSDERTVLVESLELALYGTELPDNGEPVEGIGDTRRHHIYYDSNGQVTDAVAAERAQEEYVQALYYLGNGDRVNADKRIGVMSHYIVDLAVFGHVMGVYTPWGSESHHSDYEGYVQRRTTSPSSEFDSYIEFDGSLANITPYNAALELAYDTTFDSDGQGHGSLWMDANYDWSNQAFKDELGESLNLAANYLADVLHTLYVESSGVSTVPPQPMDVHLSSAAIHVLISEVFYDTPGTDSKEEFIKLFNPLATSVDVGDWTISDNTNTYTIPSNTVIRANSSLTVAKSDTGFKDLFSISPDVSGLTLSLNNGGDKVVLKDKNDGLVDFMAYENFEPGWDITASTGASLQRKDLIDTDSVSDWTADEPSPSSPWGAYVAVALAAAGTLYGSPKKGGKKK